MADYHISSGLFGIYAGTLMPKKDGKPQMWRNKSDVTDEAICAVRDYMVNECLDEKAGKIRGGYEWTRKDGKKVLLMVEVVDGENTMIDKTMRKATGKQCSKIVGEHCGRLQELAEALRGDLPGSDRAGAEKDDGQQRENLQRERRTV